LPAGFLPKVTLSCRDDFLQAIRVRRSVRS
jgi:hypothetical protein